MKIELDQILERGLNHVFVGDFFEIAQAAGVVDGFHLRFGVDALLGGEKRGVIDVRRKNFHFPWRRNQRLRRRHVKGQRIAQVVVGQRVADENRERVRFLARGTSRAPDAERPIAAFLFALQDFFENDFLEEIELRANAKKARLIDREIFKQRRELLLAFAAGEQAVVAVERIHLAGFQAALKAVAQEMGAALVEKHAAFLVDQRLQELQFGFGERHLRE